MTNQRKKNGFTLIETLVSLAIAAVIVPAVAMTTSALFTHPERINDSNLVLQEVQKTGYWISRDVKAANNVTVGGPSGFPLTLHIPVDTVASNDQAVVYAFVGNTLK